VIPSQTGGQTEKKNRGLEKVCMREEDEIEREIKIRHSLHKTTFISSQD
jgi:hypothetical protein